MPRQRNIAIEIKAKDKFSREFKSVSRGLSDMAHDAEETSKTADRSFKSISRTAKATLGIVVTGAIRDLSVQLGELSQRGGQVEETQRVFERLSESIGATMPDALGKLREATHGMVSDMDLMQASNKFVSMGLAETSDRAAELAEMSTQLGMAMGAEPVAAAENFALMLANQSIPRLDTYGISAGKTRGRILELMEANKEMTREQAFTQAVMEQGRIAMERVGSSAGGTAERMAQATARSANFRDMLARRLGPALAGIAGPLSTFASTVGPMGQVAMGLTGLTDLLPGMASGIVGLGKAAGNSISSLLGMAGATGTATTANIALKASLAEIVLGIAAVVAAAYLFEKHVTPRLGLPDIPERWQGFKDSIHLGQLALVDFTREMLGHEPVHAEHRRRIIDSIRLYGEVTDEVREWGKAQKELTETIIEAPAWYKQLEGAVSGLIDTSNDLVDVYTGKHLPMWYRQIEATGEYIEGIDEAEVAQNLLAATTWKMAEYQLEAWDALAEGPEGLIAGMKRVGAVTKDEFFEMVQAQADAQADMDKQAKVALKKRLDERKRFARSTAKLLANLSKSHQTNTEAREKEEERYTSALEELREKEGDAYRRGYVNVERMKAENAEKLADIEERYSKRIRRASEKRRGELVEDMNDLTQKEREQGEERIGAALRNAAIRKSAQLGAIAEAKAAEEERHQTAMAQFATEREEMLMTAGVQALAARTYEDGTTALSRLFGDTIESADDLFEVMETGTHSLAKRDLVALARAMQVVAKQESRNQGIAEDNKKLWAEALKEGKKLHGEHLEEAAKIEPAYRDIFDSQETLIDQIIEGQSEYDRWGENAVRNIEGVDSELVILDATMQTHYGTTGLVAVAYETMAARARAAIASIPPFPTIPGYTPPPSPIAPLPPWYPPRAYQRGGIVPGPIGRPQMAVVHGGETILPARRQGGVILDFRGAQFYGVTQDFVEDLFKEHELLRELQGVRGRNP